jgi:hypothetical protein
VCAAIDGFQGEESNGKMDVLGGSIGIEKMAYGSYILGNL